ncbi:conserved hypothetical protein [Limnobacter sp. 130]|uniref:PAAR domain-containing protein n=1 Tax=Limnobacter sp. 130 TaxID=2653147 RepID=UPI0012F3818F|nr:PAAR domain-containing protein [Limnobacter sp. 130]VWX33024.1 conserved hypothetical protein [Limnobacter sp. 130]
MLFTNAIERKVTRPIINGKAQVVVGDATSHGGKVISGSPTTTWGPGKIPIARVGDMVTCPKCKPHLFPIVEGSGLFTDNYMAVATHGDKVACGATLIAAARPLDYNFGPDDLHFNDRYILRDSEGVPMPNTYYGVKFPNGSTSFFTTSESGETEFFDTQDEIKDLNFFIAG